MKDKIYYCKITGQVLLILANLVNVKETEFEEDYLMYSVLNKRTKETIELIKLDYGEYIKLSKGSTGVSVNLETKELEFTYEESQPIPQEETEIEIIQKKISILEAENANLKEGLQAILSGDMQSLAYILYPEDFSNTNNTTLEL